jgi:hypothetical protein
MKFTKIKISTLKEIIRDFKKTGFDLSMECFEDWFGFKLDPKSEKFVESSLYQF